MRSRDVIAVLMLLLMLGVVRSGAVEKSPAASDRAGWADWEAQARIMQGDYDGAVQAEQQAEAGRREAQRQDLRRK